jgi:hypothetical protein
MSDSPLIQVFLSLSSLFVLIAIFVGPIPNLVTNCEKHEQLCNERKMMFATLMYWALTFLAIYSFSTGSVFTTVKSLSKVVPEAAKTAFAAAKVALATAKDAASSAVASASSGATAATGAVASVSA